MIRWRSTRALLILAVVVVVAVIAAAQVLSLLQQSGAIQGNPLATTLNTPSTPITTDQLFSAYFIGNQAAADSTYTNKYVYVTGNIYSVYKDPQTGNYLSSTSGAVILTWQSSSQALAVPTCSFLSTTCQPILAKCLVTGVERSIYVANGQTAGLGLFLQDCTVVNPSALVSTTLQTSTPNTYTQSSTSATLCSGNWCAGNQVLLNVQGWLPYPCNLVNGVNRTNPTCANNLPDSEIPGVPLIAGSNVSVTLRSNGPLSLYVFDQQVFRAQTWGQGQPASGDLVEQFGILTYSTVLAIPTSGNWYFLLYNPNTSQSVEISFMVASPVQPATPVLEGSSWNYQVSSSIGCTLPNVQTGDVIFAVLQSTGTQQSTMTASDNMSNSYSYITNWPIYGIGGAYANALGSGVVSVQLTVGTSTGGLSLFCFDIAGAKSSVSSSQSPSSDYSGNTVTSLAVSPFNVTPSSLVVAVYAVGGSASFSAGSGFTLTFGTPILGRSGGTIGSEWGLVNSSSTTCPMTGAHSGLEGWVGMCFAFPPS